VADCVLHPEASAPEPDLMARLRALPTAVLSDSLQRLGGAPGVLPVPGTLGDGRLVGPALTVRRAPGDNLVVHKALDLARPGDVMVVDAGGHTDRAMVGGLMCRYAVSRGIAGVVIDGAVRDVAELPQLGLPVFARAVCHQGPYKNGPGEIRGRVSIAGVSVAQGDLIVGDEDGIFVLPRARASEITAAAEAHAESERKAVEAIDAGRWDRAWIDQALELREVSGGGA
jgi:regulator of RNase E activity RraA